MPKITFQVDDEMMPAIEAFAKAQRRSPSQQAAYLLEEAASAHKAATEFSRQYRNYTDKMISVGYGPSGSDVGGVTAPVPD